MEDVGGGGFWHFGDGKQGTGVWGSPGGSVGGGGKEGGGDLGGCGGLFTDLLLQWEFGRACYGLGEGGRAGERRLTELVLVW